MSILDALISFIAPFDCLGCNREGQILCDDCARGLKLAPSICYRCEVETAAFQTCPACSKSTALQALRPAAIYGGTAKAIVWRLKFTGAQAAAVSIAKVMASLFQPQFDTYIVPVPTASSRARQRGFDQAALIAKAYARLTGTAYLPCLTRFGQKQQRGSKGLERRQQLNGMYAVTKLNKIKGSNILLIDDVATTGATLEAAAETLRLGGAQNIQALVFTRA